MKNLSKEIETLRSSKNSHYLLDEMWAYKPFARKMQELDVSYEESQEQLPMLSRFYESMKYCDTSCPGLEDCDSPMPHYVCQLSRNDLNQLERTQTLDLNQFITLNGYAYNIEHCRHERACNAQLKLLAVSQRLRQLLQCHRFHGQLSLKCLNPVLPLIYRLEA